VGEGYHLIISSFILYRVDNGNWYIGERMEIKIDYNTILAIWW